MFRQLTEKKIKGMVPNNTNIQLTAIWTDITYALDVWLPKISELEERQREANGLQERINRTLLQLQQDGLVLIYDFEEVW